MAIQHMHSPLTLRDMDLHKLQEMVKDRAAWHAASVGSQRVRHSLATEQQHQFHLLFNVFSSWALQKIVEESLLWWLYIIVAFFIPSSHSLTWHSFFLTGALHKQMFLWARSVFRSYSQEATANSEPFSIEKVFKLFFPVSLPLSAVNSIHHQVEQLLSLFGPDGAKCSAILSGLHQPNHHVSSAHFVLLLLSPI